jgi:hypothetical protein
MILDLIEMTLSLPLSVHNVITFEHAIACDIRTMALRRVRAVSQNL